MGKRFILQLFITIILILLILVGCSSEERQQNIQPKEGYLDIRNKTIGEIDPINLDGEWEFYWGDFLTSTELTSQIVTPSIVNVPNTWESYQSTEQYGYATYRLKILINERDVGKVISIYMPGVATAYELWINGEKMASSGSIGTTKQEMIPKTIPQLVTFTSDKSEMDLFIHVSNFHQRKSGLWDSLVLGTAEQMMPLREKKTLLQGLIVGSIFIIGFYHLIMFLFRKKNRSALFLSLTCFAITLRTLLLNDALLIKLLPSINWELAVTLEYLANTLGLLFFLLFINREMYIEKLSKLNLFYIGILFLYSIFIIATPAWIFTNTLSFFQILAIIIIANLLITTIYSIKKKLEGVYLHLMALFVIAIAVLNDFLYYTHKLETEEFVSLGLLFYLFIQSIHLARISSRSFAQTEKLTEDLYKLNISLEEKVEERTEQLQEANKDLKRIEKARRRLLASVSHELNTPLTFIQGYVKAILDGVVTKDDSYYLRAVYNDTQMMSHMIEDLQELSKFESGHIAFHFTDTDIQLFIKKFYEEQKSIYTEKNLQIYYREIYTSPVPTRLICTIDPIRIRQVISNLLVNAQKFTPSGGTVSIEIELPSLTNNKEVKMRIKDTGSGIHEEDIPYIFERFYKANDQGDSSRRGAGLGLAICKEIIDFHEGEIGVTSQVEEGSSFYFTLPLKGEQKWQKRGKS